jgi:hypothetical protein
MTALAALGSTVMALRKNKTEEYDRAVKSLHECRLEVEKLSEEVHKYRMQEIEEKRDEPPPTN